MTAALTVVVVVVAGTAGAVLDARFTRAGRPEFRMAEGAGYVFVAAILASAAVGVTLLVRRPRHPVGWLFAALGMSIAIAGSTESYGVYGLIVRPGSLPAAGAAAVLSSSLFVIWLIVVALVCSLTPDGQHLSPRWRLASNVMVGCGAVWFLLKLIAPGPLESPFGDIQNPWAITTVNLDGVRLVAAVVNNVLVLVAAASVVVRFRRSRGEARRQLLWMAVVAVPFPFLVVLAFAASVAGNEALVNLSAAGFVVLLPVGAGFAVTRYHLYDIDRILSRAVSYLIASTLIIGTYAAVVFVVAEVIGQAANRSPTATTAATLAAAAAARPVYLAVRDAIDQRFLRRRYEALRQVREFVARPSGHGDVEAVLRKALDAPSLCVAYKAEDRDGWVTEQGRVVDVSPDSVFVDRAGRTIAAVTAIGRDDPVASKVLEEAAPELDNARLRAAIAVQLEEVRASRERIAEAQLDERRRIERDLHDGAQQRLLGSAAQMQAALLNGEPERMRTALECAVSEARTAVAELRSLANGLHPAVLADGGLASALDDLALRLPVSVVVPPDERRYPPLVEATMWFVACEAIANAMKHAAPTAIEVRLQDADGELRLVVEDDGRGGADPTGTGLRGIADRVEAAGGQFAVTSEPSAGTRVEAVLPCGS